MMPEQAPMTQATPQAPMVQAARGGIMGFKEDGFVEDPNKDALQAVLDAQKDDEEGGTGNAEDRAFYGNESRRIYNQLANEQLSPGMTEDQRRANTLANYKEVQAMAGPSPYEAQAARMADLEKQQTGNLQQQKGLAALAAIPAILQGGNAIRGLGGGAGAFAGAYGKAVQADRAEKVALMSMKNNLEDAQYKLRVGLVGDARQLTAEARRDKQAADAAKIAKLKALGTLAATNERANRPVKAAAANFDIQNRDAIAADLRNTNPIRKGETEAQYTTRLQAMAAREIYGAKGTKDITSRSNVTSNVTSTSDISGTKGDIEQQKADTSAMAAEAAALDKARAALNKFSNSRDARRQKQWQDMIKEYGSKEAAGEAYVKDYMVKNPTTAAPAAKPAAAAPAKSVLPSGTTTGRFVQGKGTEVLKDGKVIGYAN
jgi:hypothetical protein